MGYSWGGVKIKRGGQFIDYLRCGNFKNYGRHGTKDRNQKVSRNNLSQLGTWNHKKRNSWDLELQEEDGNLFVMTVGV
jgi:hypothetical protein